MRTTACAGDVDLQVKANIVFDVDAAMEMDWSRKGEEILATSMKFCR